jgi:hypothetical protein
VLPGDAFFAGAGFGAGDFFDGAALSVAFFAAGAFRAATTFLTSLRRDAARLPEGRLPRCLLVAERRERRAEGVSDDLSVADVRHCSSTQSAARSSRP